jgi:sugar-specific transcriptional regulator TrmB
MYIARERAIYLMQEDLDKELEVLGFTLNQAKVYLAIVRAGSISVGKIAESSKLYRQDVYKILPKLEKKGVITKTLGTPIVIKAVPVKKALKTLVSNERIRALERIIRMETHLEELSYAVNEMFEKGMEPKKEETHFSLLTQDNEINNRADLLYEKAKKECNIAASIELMTIRGPNFHKRFQTATNNGAKVKLLIEAPRIEERIESAIERVRPDSDNFCAKFTICKSPKPFQIIDRKEVWIATTLKSESGTPSVLWSNGINIVAAYQERFERLWSSKKAITVYPPKPAKKKAAKAVAVT